MQTRTLQVGVTIVELLIVVSIAGIMAAIAAPSFASFIASTRLTSTMSQLSSDLNRARSEAIKRNTWVLFCKSNAAHTDCATATPTIYHAIPVNSDNHGWLVCYTSSNGNACETASAVTAANPNPIAVHDALNTSMTLVSGANTPIHFNPNGTQGAAIATLTLTLVKPDGTALVDSSYATSSVANIAATGYISKTP
jgi:type IV fimbrial biogenesis protein FimT